MHREIRYILYVRKSTDDKSRQVRSIEAQLAEMQQIETRDGLKVIDVLIEKKSAKTPGRPIFNHMLERIEAGEADGILAWHADRLARNSIDGGRLIYLFDTGKLQRLQFYGSSVENSPQGKMMLNTEFGFSKYYVDSLSVNTARGHRIKVAKGEFPNHAPLGYLNDSRIKRIIVDRERAPVVKRAFERYARGGETLESVASFFAEKGIVTRPTKKSEGGKPLNKKTISKLLSNPVYYGHFRFKGEDHLGVHRPIFSKQLFDSVQSVIRDRVRYSSGSLERTKKPFTGLLRCAECGCSITAEIQKGHTYYRCTKKAKELQCSQPYIREEILDSQLSALLRTFEVPETWANEMLSLLETDRISTAASNMASANVNRGKIQNLTSRLQKLKEGYLDGLIDGPEFRSEKNSVLSQIKTLEENTDALTSGTRAWLEPFRKWILEAQTLGQIVRTGSRFEKSLLAKKVFGSNLLLDRKKARGEAVNPWTILSVQGLTCSLAHVFHTARTFFQQGTQSG